MLYDGYQSHDLSSSFDDEGICCKMVMLQTTERSTIDSLSALLRTYGRLTGETWLVLEESVAGL